MNNSASKGNIVECYLHIKLTCRLVYDIAERHDGFLDCLAAMTLTPETDQPLGKSIDATILVLVLLSH
jgi:hypothetical protein